VKYVNYMFLFVLAFSALLWCGIVTLIRMAIR
jgi:hypothetical protein